MEGLNTEKMGLETEKKEDRLILELSKAYTFEGNKYTQIDLHGLESLTATDMIAVNRNLSRNGNTDYNQEMTLEYACALASRGTEHPIEFFKGLPPKDAIKLKGRVTGFLYGVE